MIALKKIDGQQKKYYKNKKINIYGSIQCVVVLPIVLKMISRHEIKNDPTYFFSALY